MRPMTFCSAASRIEQLLMTMRSASSKEPASAQPAPTRAPAISSESEVFIWQPSVQTWKRGWISASMAYSARPRAARGVGRGGASRRAGMSRTGSAARTVMDR
jgi:hypothetical protein